MCGLMSVNAASRWGRFLRQRACESSAALISLTEESEGLHRQAIEASIYSTLQYSV